MVPILVKILFPLDPQDRHGHGAETLWAEHVDGSDWAKFRIKNSPFFTMGVSLLDVVCAAPAGDGFLFEFVCVAEMGGNSTYMLLVDDEANLARGNWKVLENLGCSYEGMHIDLGIGRKLLLRVDVPDCVDIVEAHGLIADGAGKGSWVYQIGYSTFVEGMRSIS